MSKAALENEAKKAAELWEKLKFEGKTTEEVAAGFAAEWDTSNTKKACLTDMLRLVMGNKGDMKKFVNFVQTFGPMEEPDGDECWILPRLVKDFWNEKEKKVAAWFHGDVNGKDASKLVQQKKVHGAFLIRMSAEAGSLTLDRLSEKNGKMMQAKSRLENRGEGWYCQEKKKIFPSIGDYLKARGPDSDAPRLCHPVPRKTGDAVGTKTNFYADCFDVDKKS